MDKNEKDDEPTFHSCEVCGKWLEGHLLFFCLFIWPICFVGQGMVLGHK